MNIASAIVIYIIVWWTVFFAVLPWGVRGIWESPESHARGAEQGAPEDPQIMRKVKRTTWISAIIWAVICLVIVSGIIDFRE